MKIGSDQFLPASTFSGVNGRTATTMLLVLLIASCLLGCVPLRGSPDDITKDEIAALSATNLTANLSTAQTVAERWRGDRNKAYDYSFWSNATLIPLAAGGAGAALFKGSHDLVTGIGLAAGTLIGTNSFIGASPVGS